jgi:hypothetical protein
MNPTEQLDRQTAIKKVNDRIDHLAAAVDAEVAEQFQNIRELISRLLTAERGDRLVDQRSARALQLEAGEQINLNAANIVTVNFYLAQFLAMNLRERIRWVALGRLPEHFLNFQDDPESILFPDPSEIARKPELPEAS